MADNKSIVEEALLQMKNLEQVVAENAKGILASTMKEEISELVKESLKEAEHAEEMDEQEDEILALDMDSEESDEEGDDMEMDSDEEEMDIEIDSEEDDELPIDLTGASDEEILKVFKAMSDEDGIIVTQDDDQVHIEDEDADVEYIIQMEGEEEEESMTEMDEQMDMDVEVEDEEISDEELDAMIADIFNESEMGEGEDYDHYRGAEKDDASHIRKLEKDMEYDSEYTEEMDEEEDEVVYEIEMDEEEDDMDDMTESKMTIKPVMGHTKAAKLTTKAETKEAAIEPKGKAKGVGMNLSPKKFEFTEEEMEEGKDWGSNKHEYKRKSVDGVKKKAGEGKDGHYKDYEGKFGGNKGDKSKTHPGKKDYEKSEAKEAARTYGMGSKEGRGLRKGITNNRNYVYGDNGVKVESIQTEVQRLREKNEEYRKALNVFREKLNEVAVFNSNLAYATRLFTEHTTTKQEKINILRRFDDVESLKESKSLYNSIKNELNNTTQNVVTESVSKIEKSPASGSAQNLIESKTYENPQFLRMKDIMQKINK
jgi:hypothetical protein